MPIKHTRFRIGLRAVKSSIAVVLSMLIVESLGTTDSRLIFAMIGAMTAVQITFKDSVEACLTQLIGLVFGATVAVALRFINLHSLMSTGIGIILVIALYNLLNIHFSPSLPCFIVVMICIDPSIQPIQYAAGRLWDTTIGLGVGMLINTLVFPYDNSRQIRTTIESLDQDLIKFLEELFDGDDIIPDTNTMLKTTRKIERQLSIFAGQRFLLRLRRQKHRLETFHICERKVHELVARMGILCCVGIPGILNEENRNRLTECGANIQDMRNTGNPTDSDIVTNYHITQILEIRRELSDALKLL